MLQNIKDLPRDIKLVLGNRHRRRNFLWRAGEALIEMLAFLIALNSGFNILLSFLLGWLAGFIAFEYVAEPAGWTGPWYERGPRFWEGEGVDKEWEE